MYQTIHTNYGLQRLAAAVTKKVPINLVQMAVGDGNGNPAQPDPAQQHLVREIYRTAVNRVVPDPNDPTLFTAEMVIPATVGGFTLREAGIYDDAGALFAVANVPDTYKPPATEGSFSDTVLRMQFVATNASIVSIMVDPNVAVATQSWIRNNITIGRLLPGGTTGQIATKASNADGDITWANPANVNVVVSTIEEAQVLAANQLVVNLAKTTTSGLAVYIGGARLPRSTAANGWQPTPSSTTSVTLGQSYPAGSQIIAVQNEPASQLGKALQQSLNLSDLADTPTARANLSVYSKSESDRLAPASAIAYFASGTVPTGWLKANGAAVSRAAYSTLFAAIGTTFGVGDGFNTFNLPDLRGEFIRGLDDGRGVDAGRLIGTAQGGQNAAHSHVGTTDTSGSHSHNYLDGRPVNTPFLGLPNGNVFPGVWERIDTESTDYAGAHSHSFTTGSSGGAEARPRNVALLACIKY